MWRCVHFIFNWTIKIWFVDIWNASIHCYFGQCILVQRCMYAIEFINQTQPIDWQPHIYAQTGWMWMHWKCSHSTYTKRARQGERERQHMYLYYVDRYLLKWPLKCTLSISRFLHIWLHLVYQPREYEYVAAFSSELTQFHMMIVVTANAFASAVATANGNEWWKIEKDLRKTNKPCLVSIHMFKMAKSTALGGNW